MREVSGAVSRGESRQSMIRVWMAMSAVWVAFWLLITALFLGTIDPRNPLDENISSFAAIILTPPLALLAFGALGRWTFEKVAQRRSRLP